jgi:hypothetical protein
MTGLLFILSAFLLFQGWNLYWLVLLCAFIFSQALILRYWSLFKYGTIINVFLLIIIVGAAVAYNFDQQVNEEIISLNKRSRHFSEVITEQKLESVPDIIKTWLTKSGVVNKTIPSIVYITQKGELRSKENGPWNKFIANQHFSLDPPAFVWDADIQVNDFVKIKGRDKFEDGKGNMLIKVNSFLPIANSSGKEVDQGTLIRFMAEISWFPQAALKDYVRWEQIDSTHARAFMTYGTASASGIFTFGSNGLPVLFEAKRLVILMVSFYLKRGRLGRQHTRLFKG